LSPNSSLINSLRIVKSALTRAVRPPRATVFKNNSLFPASSASLDNGIGNLFPPALNSKESVLVASSKITPASFSKQLRYFLSVSRFKATKRSTFFIGVAISSLEITICIEL